MAILFASPVVRAEEGDVAPVPSVVEGAQALPFSDADLQRALLARLLQPPAASPGVRVDRASDGTVVVRAGNQTRVVGLGDRTGPAAARVVALVIADMLATAPAAAPAAPPPTPAAVAPPIITAAPVETAPAPVRPTRAARLCVTGGASKGTGTQELLATELDVEVVLPVAGPRWRWSPSAGLVVMPTRNAGTLDEVSFVAGVARLLAGRAWGPSEVLVGPFASAYCVGGAASHAGVLFGAEVVARVAAPLSARLRLIVDGRADVYANRVRVHWVDGNAYATPRVGLSAGAGLAWDWPS